MAKSTAWRFVVWERLNKTGKWCPYSAVVSQFLEQSFKKNQDVVSLENADDDLKIYSVNFKDMIQTSATTGTKCSVRRHLCDNQSTICQGFAWQWSSDHSSWHPYDIDVSNFIEEAFQKGLKHVTLKKAFRGYNYEIDLVNMMQINKQTKRKRPIRRNRDLCPYPVVKDDTETNFDTPVVATAPEVDYSHFTQDIPGTSELFFQVNEYARNAKRTFVLDDNQGVNNLLSGGNTIHNIHDNSNLHIPATSTTVALVNGKPWYDSRPPHTPHSLLKPVPGIDPLPTCNKKEKKKKKAKRENNARVEVFDVLQEYTNEVKHCVLRTVKDDCIICCEPLIDGSSYDGSTSVVQLKLCPHIFHRACLSAMYNSGSKDRCLQCPVCKKIHGVKFGTQPPGEMVYHILPYSLPSFPEYDTIRIIYDIPSGIQGPEHPDPGKRFSSRGFPRHCYLPDNETGRKVMRLLVKAWQRRLIFTIGRSSTTGEEGTVTWNEIHHKTEFGCNQRGHGYPDPNYFDNILSELKAHGVDDDDGHEWYPA